MDGVPQLAVNFMYLYIFHIFYDFDLFDLCFKKHEGERASESVPLRSHEQLRASRREDISFL